jgi:sugar phosphate permease
MSTTATTAERSQPLPPNADAVESIYSKVSWRIIPLLLISYMVAYLDRINIGYAQLQMKQTLPFGDAVYGLGAGIFFLGYFLFEVPSNLLLERIGARKTLLRIMVLWGLTAAAMMFVTTPTQFYIDASCSAYSRRVSFPASSSISLTGIPPSAAGRSLRSSCPQPPSSA